MPKHLSFVIPVHNEEATLKLLFDKIQLVMFQTEIDSYEVIFIDDGSRDYSWQEITDLASQHPKLIKAIKLRRNFGKSAALSAGFRNAAGIIIFTLDADLQDDPAEIPKFLHHLESGFDLGFKIGEVVVEHYPRKHGKSNYGWERYARGFLDLLTVLATTQYLHKPGHLFGGLGLCFGLVGTVSLSYLIVIWFLNFAGMNFGPIGNRPLLFFGILCTILSVQLISLGILAELMARNVDDDYVDKQISEIIDDSGFDI